MSFKRKIRMYSVAHHLILRMWMAVYGRVINAVYLSIMYIPSLYANKIKSDCKDVWLFGEDRGGLLFENSWCFYQYCKENCKEKTVYFLLKRDNTLYSKYIHDRGVVPYGSFKHARIFLLSGICFYTHTYRDVMYRRLFEIFGKKKKLVFLHHGVLGFKRFNSFYFKKRNVMNVMTVGNHIEREILVNHVGLDKDRIEVTGYARFDNFFRASDIDKSRVVLYMPTHRNYVRGVVSRSEFLAKVDGFLRSIDKTGSLEKSGVSMKVYLHKEFQKLTRLIEFESKNIKFVYYGEASVSSLLKEASLLVTDYSSVSWDFFSLGRPVMFYRFDLDEYLNDRGSYLDLRENIIGDVCMTECEAVQSVVECIGSGFRLKKEYDEMRSSIGFVQDGNSCKRIYETACRL